MNKVVVKKQIVLNVFAMISCIILMLTFTVTTVNANPNEMSVAVTAQQPMNGIAITENGRQFVSMPQWTDTASPSLAEVMKDGSLQPYPGGQWNALDTKAPHKSFINVNAVRYDGRGSLWVVDYSAPFFGPEIKGGQKLVKIDLATNSVKRVYTFDSVLPKKAKLNDVRLDLDNEVAYLTEFGVGALLVLDLKTGKSRRVLDQHYSTRAHPDVVTYFEDQPFKTHMLQVNDLELSPDKKTLYFQATGGPVMYKIESALLRDPSLNDRELGKAVEVFSKSMTVGGMTRDSVGNLYLGDVENKSIVRLNLKGEHEVLLTDENMLWPDALTIHEGYLYIPCPQIRLLSKFHNGKSKARMPFKVFKVKL